MEILVERGPSKGDCLQKIVNTYGVHFNILKEKKIRSRGFLGLFARDEVEIEFALTSNNRYGWQAPPPQDGSVQLPGAEGRPLAAIPAAIPRDDSTLDFETAKKRILAAAGKNPDQIIQLVQEQDDKEAAQQKILDKLREIQEQIGAGKETRAEHPNLVRISQMLRQNDFSERYAADLLDRAHKELPLETLENFKALQDRFLDWIGESIKVFNTQDREKSGRVMVLVGPTGVGKTTTIAKLAAIYSIQNSGNRPLTVRMITIDAFKIGAGEQIGAFGDIMDIDVSKIDNRRELRRDIDLYREECDLILVDTIGRSPRDSVRLGEMKELLDACGSRAEVHLVLSASTKTSDIEHILQQFEPFNYQAVLLTKLDETNHVGNIISALTERKKPVSYITDGQIVPKDIKKATVVRFLISLDEFQVDREAIEKRFPAAEADQFQWG